MPPSDGIKAAWSLHAVALPRSIGFDCWLTCPGRLRWEKRQSRPTRTDDGDPLVKAVWETGVEVRLERHGASPHVPRCEASQCPDGVWLPAKFPIMEKHNDLEPVLLRNGRFLKENWFRSGGAYY